MSPGNSYFKYGVVKELLQKVVEKYGKAAIMIADVPAISTYVALGYPQNRARRDKALPQGNALKNKVKKAMVELGYSADQVIIIDWKNQIENNSEYKEKYSLIEGLYQTNSLFQNAADATTKGILAGAGEEILDLPDSIKIAAHYLLAEIAFMEFAPDFLKVKKATYIYHRSWPVFESYIDGKFDDKSKDYLGFEIIEI
ncbi:MAG: uncharacterized protein JWP09_819 [Candidatus Taylorbacteria bacterium]|nr:uncharacterized protein [Candidatus Taylorbacteria bacterium]